MTSNHPSTSLHHTLTHSATYDVQDAQLLGGRGNISFLCEFASGSQARGCHVEIRNSSIEMTITRSGSPLSHTAEQTVTGLAQGAIKCSSLTGREMVHLLPHHPIWGTSMSLVLNLIIWALSLPHNVTLQEEKCWLWPDVWYRFVVWLHEWTVEMLLMYSLEHCTAPRRTSYHL